VNERIGREKESKEKREKEKEKEKERKEEKCSSWCRQVSKQNE
jgi:hypothetical protein